MKDDLRDIVFVTDVSAQSSGEYSKASFQNGPTFQGPTSRLMKYHQIHSDRCWFRYIQGSLPNDGHNGMSRPGQSTTAPSSEQVVDETVYSAAVAACESSSMASRGI